MIGIVGDKVRAAYNVPAGHDPLTAIAIGYAAQVPPDTQDPLAQRDLAPRSRKRISEFVVSTWGQPAKLSSAASGQRRGSNSGFSEIRPTP